MPTPAHSDLAVPTFPAEGSVSTLSCETAAAPSLSPAAGHSARWNEPWNTAPAQPVGKQKGLGASLAKGWLYFTALVIGCLGFALVASTVYNLIHDIIASHGQINTVLFLLSESIFLGAMGLIALYRAKTIFDSARSVAASAPTTQHNNYLLEVETLLRASALLPTSQQAEFLRTCPNYQETSAGEPLPTTQG